MENLPARERRKVLAYVDVALRRREDAADRKAVKEARSDSRPAVPWKAVKARLGLG